MSWSLTEWPMRPTFLATGAPTPPASTDASAPRSVHMNVAPLFMPFSAAPLALTSKLGVPSTEMLLVSTAAHPLTLRAPFLGALLKRSHSIEQRRRRRECLSQAARDATDYVAGGTNAYVPDHLCKRDSPWILVKSWRTLHTTRHTTHLAVRRQETHARIGDERKLSKSHSARTS